jgi:Fe2+ transport system protein B
MSEVDLKEENEEGVEIDIESTETESNEPEQKTESTSEISVVEEKENDDELTDYSKNVQKRIKKLTEKYRQEERDKEEASRLAQTLREENENLRSQMQNSQQAHLTEYGSRIDNQLGLAKQAYKDAPRS